MAEGIKTCQNFSIRIAKFVKTEIDKIMKAKLTEKGYCRKILTTSKKFNYIPASKTENLQKIVFMLTNV